MEPSNSSHSEENDLTYEYEEVDHENEQKRQKKRSPFLNL